MNNKKLKKAFIVLLTAALLLVFSMTPVMAASLKFTDITASRYDWARPYIEKMTLAGVVKGTSQTTYGPDSPVTREQLITMLIRLLGWEAQASGKTLPQNFVKPESVAPYARGCVALAVEKGILSEKDIKDFRPGDAAKRYEVAVFTVRALGLGSEAESRKNTNIHQIFVDAYTIVPEARPYVEIAVEKGIMKGLPGNIFDPDGDFTRAQMATVLHNLSKLTKAHNIISGTVQTVDTTLLPSVEVKLTDGGQKMYTVNTDTLIYKENEKGNLIKSQLKDIKNGDYISIIASINTAQYIDITSSSQSDVNQDDLVEGTIKDINTYQNTLTITGSDNKEKAYFITTNTKIYINGKMSTLYDLVEGQSVKLTTSGNNIEKINAKGVDKVVEGIIRAVNISTNTLTIENKVNDKYEMYTIESGARINRDDKSADIYQLRIGDKATVTVSGSKIEKIEAESAEKEVSGVITDISFATKNPVLTVENELNRETDYELDDDVTIRKNSKRADISDLKIGDDVTLTLEYNVAVRVVAKSMKGDISGSVKALTFADTNTVTIVDDKGKEHVITITRDTEIFKDRRRIEVSDLRKDYYLDIEMENDEAIRIDVTVRKVQDTVRGTVVNVNDDVKVIVISVKNDDGTKDTHHVYYTKDTIIYKENREVRVSRIEEGDEVLSIGRYDGGLFFADTIHDLTIEE